MPGRLDLLERALLPHVLTLQSVDGGGTFRLPLGVGGQSGNEIANHADDALLLIGSQVRIHGQRENL